MYPSCSTHKQNFDFHLGHFGRQKSKRGVRVTSFVFGRRLDQPVSLNVTSGNTTKKVESKRRTDFAIHFFTKIHMSSPFQRWQSRLRLFVIIIIIIITTKHWTFLPVPPMVVAFSHIRLNSFYVTSLRGQMPKSVGLHLQSHSILSHQTTFILLAKVMHSEKILKLEISKMCTFNFVFNANGIEIS